jgi:hypothetical protein
MNPSDTLWLAVASPTAPTGAVISLTDALLVLCFAGLLVAAYQLNRVLLRLDRLERRLAPRGARPEPVAPAAATSGRLPPQILAAIAAACEEQCGAEARIVSITDGADHQQGWSLEGRRQIFASHQVR